MIGRLIQKIKDANRLNKLPESEQDRIRRGRRILHVFALVPALFVVVGLI